MLSVTVLNSWIVSLYEIPLNELDLQQMYELRIQCTSELILTVSADFPTPPDPKTTILYSDIAVYLFFLSLVVVVVVFVVEIVGPVRG